MRIIIDLQGAQTNSRFRGIGRYTISLTSSIIRNAVNDDVFILLNGHFPENIDYIKSIFTNLIPENNIKIWNSPGQIYENDENYKWYNDCAKLMREYFILNLEPDIIHIMSPFEGYSDNAITSIGILNKSIPVSVILYDIIPYLNQEKYLIDEKYKAYYLDKLEMIKKADCVLTISEYTKKEALDNIHDFKDEQLVNISTGIDDIFKQINVSRQEKLDLFESIGISKPFILYTGGADERKNLRRLLESFKILSNRYNDKYQLVFAGKLSDDDIFKLNKIADANKLKRENIIFTGYIKDDVLLKLYNTCDCFIFPSLHEGFGLPALEAMCCSAVTIGSNSTSIIEVINYKEALFDPTSIGDIVDKLEKALMDNSYRQRLKENALEQKKLFTWDIVAKRALLEFKKLTLRKIDLNKNELNDKFISEIVKISKYSKYNDKDLLLLANLLDQMGFKYEKKEEK